LPLLASEVVSGLGSMMTSLALPWFVLQTTGSAARTSAVLGAEIAPILILGIPAGKVAARLGAKRTLLLTQLAAAPLVAAIPILHYADSLTFPVLLVLVFLSGTLWTPFYAAQTSIVPDLVGEDERSTGVANALLQGASRSTYWLGPLTAGVLISMFDAPIVLLIDAATFVVGFLLLAFVPDRHTDVPADQGEDVLGGVRFIARHRLVRSIISAQALSQASFQGLMLALPVVAFVTYRSATIAGLLEGAWGAGALIGSVLAIPLTARRPALQLAPVAWVVQSATLWLLVLPLPVGILAAALVISGVGNGVRNPPTTAVILARVPASLRPQLFAAASALATLGGFVALIATGPSLETLGIKPTFALIAALSSIGTLLFLRSALSEQSSKCAG
jgi:MFS family permease